MKQEEIESAWDEIYEDNLLGRKNDDLNWFINLDNPIRPDYRKPKLEPGDPETNYYKWYQ